MNTRVGFWFAAAWFGCLVVAGCADHAGTARAPALKIQITSPVFADGRPIPDPYTCAGSDVSLPFTWTNGPADAKSFALIADDPDASGGTWVHWVIYSLPPTATTLPENTPPLPQLPDGVKQGVNDFGQTGYSGPCPPSGKPHRYVFKIYALDQTLDLSAGATKQELLQAMDGHVLAEGQLVGTYQRYQ